VDAIATHSYRDKTMRTTRRIPTVVAALAISAVLGSDATAQSASSSITLDSYRRARDVFMRGIDAMGGLDSIRALQDVAIQLSGARHLRGQSLRADPPYDAPASTGSLVSDVRNSRLRWEEKGSFSAGFPFHTVIVTDGRQRFAADLLQRTVTLGGNAALAAHQGFLDRLPHNILLDHLDRLPTLRWVGETTVDGVRYDVVSGAGQGGAGGPPFVRNLFFDGRTGLLARLETVGPDPFAGDAVNDVVFADYRKYGPVMIPSRRTQRVAGEVIQDHRYTDIRVNTRPADSVFTRPAGLTERQQAANAPQPERFTEVAPGIHLLENAAPGYNMLVAVFSDHLVVVDAPNNSTVTERAITTIKRNVPGKPIRYVVPTHHHGDHAGGMRGFIAEGATIVTTPGNAALFRRMAASGPHTLRPDALSRTPRAPVIETFTGRRVFTDGTRTLEVRDIGPSPHAQELLIAYVPSAGIVFQGDLLNAGNDGTSLVAGNTSTEHFAQWLDRSGLDARTILGVHSPARTREELRRAVEMMRAGQ
jgi:glyoxylase-like metal-dependent hydrolase (beta-lactamase superfamily II)